MEILEILAEIRDTKKTNELRKNGFIPGVVYGSKGKSESLKINSKDFIKIFKKAGESTLIDLKVNNKEIGKVVINDYQVDPVSGSIIHFDLYKVRMDKKMITNVPIKFINESPAVKNSGGILVKNHNIFEIKCLPGDLIHDIEVDLSVLENIDDIVRVKDLKISDKVEIFADSEIVVVTVIPPRTDQEMEALEESIEENVEGVKGGAEEKKEEGEEGEEGKEEKEGEEGKKDNKKEAGDDKKKESKK